MEFYHLKTFIAVAAAGHLTRAAENLNISQPSVSAHIKTLEDELGVCLFQRSKKGMHLTPEGSLLLDKAKSVMASSTELVNQAELIKGEAAGRVNIGINLDANTLKIPQLFERAQRDFPNLTLCLKQISSRGLENSLKSRELDCGYILGEASSPEIQTLFLKPVHYMVAGPVAWKDKLKEASAREIASLPWVVHTKGCRLDLLIEEHLGITNQKLVRALEADDETLNRMILAGAGIGLMQKQDACSAESEGRVALWRDKTLSLNLFFAYLKNRGSDQRIKAVINSLEEIWYPGSGPRGGNRSDQLIFGTG